MGNNLGKIAKPKAKVRLSKKDNSNYDPYYGKIVPPDWEKRMREGTFEPYPGYVRKKTKRKNIKQKGSTMAYPGGKG